MWQRPNSEDREELLAPEIERYQKRGTGVEFRANATFGKLDMHESLMERGVKHPRTPSSD
jgi:hypothetical protein